MATLQVSLIQSRVGRRVAALFVLCGLLPLLVLSAVTGWMVSSYLHEQEQGRLQAVAKASAMASLDRLLDIESRLRGGASSPAAPLTPGALRGVSALSRAAPDGRLVSIFGRVLPPVLGQMARNRLAAGEAALLPPVRAGEPLLLAVPTSGAHRGEAEMLIAAIDVRALWAFDEQAGEGAVARELCAAVSGGGVLGCTDRRLGDAAAVALLADTSGTGTFQATALDEAWMGAYWSAPVQAPFGIPRWTSVVVTRTADAVAPARAVIATLGLIVLATIGLTLLVSFSQIRRLLDPIARLQDGTSRLARGEFQVRVDVRTGDELQTLGEAFNGMAGDLERQFDQLHMLSVGTLEALARAIDAQSPWTAGHSTRVAAVAVAVARAMGVDEAGRERIRRGALLHDIGKIGISADILDKAGPLTEAEAAVVREHPGIGARILEPLPHCGDILPMVLQHHERIDGSGYPSGLAGDAIALDARVLAVADAYDAMTSDRPYRRGLPPRDAAVHIAAAAGSQFDSAIVDAFIDAFRRGHVPAADPIGALGKSA